MTHQGNWSKHGIWVNTKVYYAVVLSLLVYGCKTWMPYHRQMSKFEQFHIRYLHHILCVKWQDRVPNTSIHEHCNIESMEATIICSQLRWSGHITRMPDDRIPKQLFYGQLPGHARSQGGQLKCLKDSFRINLKTSASSWESLAENRPKWRQLWYQQIALFHNSRLDELKCHRQQWKDSGSNTSGFDNAYHTCDVCGCNSCYCIGLFSHKSKCHQWDPSSSSTTQSVRSIILKIHFSALSLNFHPQ